MKLLSKNKSSRRIKQVYLTPHLYTYGNITEITKDKPRPEHDGQYGCSEM